MTLNARELRIATIAFKKAILTLAATSKESGAPPGLVAYAVLTDPEFAENLQLAFDDEPEEANKDFEARVKELLEEIHKEDGLEV